MKTWPKGKTYDQWAKMSTEERLKITDFLVEANSFEKHTLWREWHEKLTWQQENPGESVTIGHLDDRPVCVSFFWDTIGGKLICFYDAHSAVVDWTMINDWLRKHFTGRWDSGTRWAHTDAMNFHLCVDHIKNG